LDQLVKNRLHLGNLEGRLEMLLEGLEGRLETHLVDQLDLEGQLDLAVMLLEDQLDLVVQLDP
jgi:hypothetical protein